MNNCVEVLDNVHCEITESLSLLQVIIDSGDIGSPDALNMMNCLFRSLSCTADKAEKHLCRIENE
ncbi:hypothetical protein ABW468_RS24640 [Escherichia coli]|nr:hypothetical protein [Escherichia coli]EIE5160656.1 hypothetical protein [Escherichia coli]EIG4177132.1 hypothetical protein [Escherichia coli]EIG9902713.1 hypothetical protein [Escherichia coli]EIN6844771.1 hypothetical protein [Escherichia coli]